MNLIFLSGNKGKVKEVNSILGKKYSVTSSDVDLPEIQSVDVEEVAKQKIIDSYNEVKKPVFCEDTGVYIEFNKGKGDYFPGALVKFYFKILGNEGIAKRHKGAKAYAVTAIGYHDGNNVHIFVGKVNGTIAAKPKGTKGFGWDAIFIPTSKVHNKKKLTFGQMDEKVKNKFSMRRNAVVKFKRFLDKQKKLNM